MATRRLVLGAVLLGLSACSGGPQPGTADPVPSSSPTPLPPPEDHGTRQGPRSAYDGQGFVVHEWGTDTVVVGSDGSLQIGLHHEEEDLPPFVEDRMKKTKADPAKVVVDVKMETPVTYFYSDRPRTVQARVSFPQGVFTQWFPRVASMAPLLMGPGGAGGFERIYDPVFDLSTPFRSELCRTEFSALRGGHLDWGTIEILPRDSRADASMPDAPLDRTTWSHARQVASNAVRTAGGDTERFLFYRGLGTFEPPVRVTAEGASKLRLSNGLNAPMGTMFTLNVSTQGGAFRQEKGGIEAGKTLATEAPAASDLKPIDTYTRELADAVTDALEDTGLYHDEAVAMVNTWKRQWFKTPGIRVLYLAPQSWTDTSIPLEIVPPPERSVRVMLMRVEVLVPEVEAADVKQVRMLPAALPQVRAHFVALGRFAEPRLRRALAILGNPASGAALLRELQGAPTRMAAD